VQAFRNWTPPGGTLGRILEETRLNLPSFIKGEALGHARASGEGTDPRPGLYDALSSTDLEVIAEIKRRSPSKGILNQAIDPATQARAYEQGGAAAISVLTQASFFGGAPDDLISVRKAVKLPILRKDFHIDRRQLEQARAERASAVLLIARALSPADLPQLMQDADTLELETIVEVRTEEELERALDAGARIVGVNSRDLETLEVDDSVPRRILPRIPANVIAIWESGVSSVADVRRAADVGADAILVGSALSKSSDPQALVRSLTGVPRQGRRG
jgi:indole-3-glycerol phosphate synthase